MKLRAKKTGGTVKDVCTGQIFWQRNDTWKILLVLARGNHPTLNFKNASPISFQSENMVTVICHGLIPEKAVPW